MNMSKKTPDRSAAPPRFWVILCALEAAAILCLYAALILCTNAPPADISELYAKPVFGETVWPEEKLPFVELNGQYREREALFMRFSEGPVDLCCLGDSITQKFEWQGALPGLLVANRGIGSDTTEGMLARLDSVAALEPKIVSVMAGINDFSYGRRPEEILETYRALLEELRLRCPGARLIVNSVLPVDAGRPATPEGIRAVNQGLEALCAELDATYLDMFQAFADENGYSRKEYTIDGVHLSPDGFSLWLSYLAPALAEALK